MTIFKFKQGLWQIFRIVFLGVMFLFCQPNSNSFCQDHILKTGWFIHPATENMSGEVISTAGADLNGWYPTTVPATVLAALVSNGVYQDPYFAENLKNIPIDQFKRPWWYRNEFSGKKVKANRHVRLVFDGINYRANVWLNKKQMAAADSVFGAFRQFELDITDDILPGKNALAVEVFPPQPGDFTIGFVDWNPEPPDASMGIWREVKLKWAGAVAIDQPFVQSKVDLETLAKATLTITATLTNHSGNSLSGVLTGEIEGIQFRQPYSLAPHEQKKVVFNPDEYKQLNLLHPRLWWPNHLGQPNLYQLKLSVRVNNEISDEQTVRFGIREVSDYFNEEGHRGYKVNSKKVLIRGGGWTDDLMLVEDAQKLAAQIHYVKQMNLNTIRLEGFWGSSQTLYDLCDENGILMMVGWSCQWEWDSYLGKEADEYGGVKTAADMKLVAESLRDQIVWLRNHPSIFVWVLGSDKLPRAELEKQYREDLVEVDPTRPALMACSVRKSSISGPTGVKMNGPYDYETPNYWYLDVKNGGAFGFNTETGPGPQPPPLESLKKMLPQNHLWPIDEVWNFHCGRNQFNTMDRYVEALNQRYGSAKDVEEFAQKAQLANYEAIRAMFEAFGVNKFKTTGIIQWMLNSAWPDMYWQLYDYYLMPNGAFYGTRTASQPVNIVYNYGDEDIYVVNDTYSAFRDLQAEIRVLNLNSQTVFSQNVQVDLDENRAMKLLELPEMTGLTSVYFIDLKLKNPAGNKIASNFYWLSTKADVLDEAKTEWFVTPIKEFADFTALKDLPPVNLKVQHRFKQTGRDQKIDVTLENPSAMLAFFIELKVVGDKSGQTILPVFWEDNYVSLLPGETKAITARFSQDDLHGEKPVFKLQGWNVPAN